MTCPTPGFLQTGKAEQVSVNTELGLLPRELPQVLPCLAGLSQYTLEPLGPEHTAGPCEASFGFPYKREKPWDIPSARKHSLGADKYGMFAAAASKGNDAISRTDHAEICDYSLAHIKQKHSNTMLCCSVYCTWLWHPSWKNTLPFTSARTGANTVGDRTAWWPCRTWPV